MWIVRLALRRPYTFTVAALLIMVLGAVTLRRMPTDIFPEIDIPVVTVIWSYGGMSTDEMEKRIVTYSERSFTTTVNDIEHIESQSMQGVSVIKVFFHPGAKIEAAVAQMTAVSGAVTRVLPPGISPPIIIRYSAASVPVLQVAVSSNSMSEQEIYDYGYNFIRTQMATIQGAQFPLPYGGKPRQIMVDIDPNALYAKGLSAADVSAAINAQNLVMPAGTAKIGEREYNVRLNSSPELLGALNNIPLKTVNGVTVFLRDVAQVRDGFAVQQNIVRREGRRASLLTVIKASGASTLDIVDRVKARLPSIMATLPPDLQTQFLFDQSIFVRAALDGVIREAIIAACLTALMILLFLGSWRSTLIVTVSIPLAIFTSIILLNLLGQTLNVMTLGGLALAVGILVDDATVEVENIHRNHALGKPIKVAILDGAQQIAAPAFVATLAICIVFVPVVFLTGAAKSLFTPLAYAVVFAMMASYLLSRTVVPTMASYLLRDEHGRGAAHGHTRPARAGLFRRFHEGFERRFERLRQEYRAGVSWALRHRLATVASFLGFVAASFLLVPFIGQDFFPGVDAGQIRLHVRAPTGTRIEETERLFGDVEATIRRVIPPSELGLVLDNIGLPAGGVNLAFTDSATIGTADGEILISLKAGHRPTARHVKALRNTLRAEYPQAVFFFQPADIVNQILNFGRPAPIDVQVTGFRQPENFEVAKELTSRVARVNGAVDVHLHQVRDQPELRINVDRDRAQQVGLTQRDVANSLLVSLSSSGQISPNYWINWQNGVNYAIAVQTPQHRLDSLDALRSTPITTSGQGGTQLLGNLATVERRNTIAVLNHFNIQPVFNVFAGVQGRDLGGVAADIDRIVADMTPKLPKGTTLAVRGQVENMRSSFVGLGGGLVFAALLVYFLMVVNFQSWVDPFIIMTSLPGAFAGIIWMLFVTQTTFSVPSLMGAIMSIGVATANSILVVTFANERRGVGDDALAAALAAGYTRLRPVIMTALAMIIGMLPMALGIGEGGEQNAPLGRAVIGGLLVATVGTLFVVPVAYSVFRRKAPKGAALHEATAEPTAAAAD